MGGWVGVGVSGCVRACVCACACACVAIMWGRVAIDKVLRVPNRKFA